MSDLLWCLTILIAVVLWGGFLIVAVDKIMKAWGDVQRFTAEQFYSAQKENGVSRLFGAMASNVDPLGASGLSVGEKGIEP